MKSEVPDGAGFRKKRKSMKNEKPPKNVFTERIRSNMAAVGGCQQQPAAASDGQAFEKNENQ